MVGVPEGPGWTNLKDGPMVLNEESSIETPSGRTGWGHNHLHTLQPGHPVSTLLWSTARCSKGLAREV